jgi:hypothetical protein
MPSNASGAPRTRIVNGMAGYRKGQPSLSLEVSGIAAITSALLSNIVVNAASQD